MQGGGHGKNHLFYLPQAPYLEQFWISGQAAPWGQMFEALVLCAVELVTNLLQRLLLSTELMDKRL